jgi:hypothetical protein
VNVHFVRAGACTITLLLHEMHGWHLPLLRIPNAQGLATWLFTQAHSTILHIPHDAFSQPVNLPLLLSTTPIVKL